VKRDFSTPLEVTLLTDIYVRLPQHH